MDVKFRRMYDDIGLVGTGKGSGKTKLIGIILLR